MYETILVPLDGSKRAEAILPHVEELARRFGAKVIFLRIVEDVMMLGYDEVVDLSMYQQDHDRLKKEAKSYLAGLEGVFKEKKINAKKIVSSYGSVVQSIIDTAAREGADLIAMASHGRGSLSRVFYGSVAAGVLHSIDRPLLIIRSRGVE
ncbi:universal stress protein [Desulfosarcina sp.]|uniref:universal stress protein n=1 Tax=Desulfosarcina sp. TaxID=2027861 RepID=UPI0029AA6A3F|nr:universal stress protein [Desulfosarcina sp.]MDX2454100.1 universal stress protein [Desulfosarcina sp.]MDX2491782.1 universal stress protein [Desulfosarcina sp.]